MLIPPPEADCYDRLITGPAGSVPFPGPGAGGITLAGVSGGAGGKLEALPPGVLEAAAGEYDLTLIEGDGSRCLPLKAWAAHEPVVPPFTTVTIGVMPLWPLGRPVSDRLVHRLPLFTALCGAAEGELLRPEHLAAILTGRPVPRKTGGGNADAAGAGRGLFAEARGERLLFFNQIDDGDPRQAAALAALLPEDFRRKLRWILAGSVKEDRVAEIVSRKNR
jgi:hypothetical protein